MLPQSSMGHNKYRTFQTGLSYKIMTDFQSFNQRGLKLKGHNKMRLGLDFKAADTFACHRKSTAGTQSPPID